MKLIEKHPSGEFCWIELSTSDQAAAKAFYTGLFAWAVEDMPVGPNEFYSMFKINGRNVGAACTLRPEQRAHGVPPHWMIYVAVESADTAARRAAELGGTILAPAFDVMDVGRMAVLEDPTGAHFCVWQAKRHTGTGIAGVPGSLCWADLSTPDPQRATAFYAALFGWTISAGEKKDPSGYLHIQNGEEFIGGIPPAAHRDAQAPPHWLPYFAVDDCDQAAAKAKKGGAKFYLEPMTMEGVGRMAVLADPQGAVFALFKDAPRP
jgi:predicted enzyme related to lactoylglutathione lyase